MPQLIHCPSGHHLKVPSKRAGHRIRCPVCNAAVSVPPLAPPPRKAETAVPTLVQDSPDSVILAASSERVIADPENRDSESGEMDNVREIAPESGALSTNVQSRPRPEESEASHDQHPSDIAAIGESKGNPNWVDEVMKSPAGQIATAPLIDVFGIAAHAGVAANAATADSRFAQEQHRGVIVLGIAALALAVICAVPSLLEQFNSLTSKSIQPPDAWTYLVLLLAVIQGAVAIYAMRLPDWSTSWCVSIVTTGAAAIYALGLALTMFAHQDHGLLKQLGLLDENFHGSARVWCFLVMCLTLALAYCYGRFSLRWYDLDRRLSNTRR